MRITTWNVRGFRDGLDRVIQVVRDLDPDVALIQESGSRRKLRRLAEASRREVVADPPAFLRRRVKNAVLLRRTLRAAEVRFERFPRSRRWYPRGMLAVRVHGGEPDTLWVVSTHLGLRPDERLRHAELLLAFVEEAHGPVVIGGDLNARSDQDAAVLLASRMDDVGVAGGSDEPTFPASAPEARIDYVFARPGLLGRGTRVGGSVSATASDHLPVTVEVAQPAGVR